MADGKVFNTVTVRSKSFNVHVDHKGRFNADVEDDTVYAETLAELEKKLAKQTSIKINQPFARYKEPKSYEKDAKPTIVRGIITGKHGRTGNLLIHWPDGTKEQESAYYHNGYSANYLTIDDSEERILIELHEDVNNAKVALEKFVREHGIKIKELWEASTTT